MKDRYLKILIILNRVNVRLFFYIVFNVLKMEKGFFINEFDI